MKKSINQWCFPMEWSWEKVFGLCEKAGFQGIEICVDYLPFIDAMRSGRHEGIIAEIAKSVGSSFQKSKALTYDSAQEEFKRVSKTARDHGVAISTLLTIAQFYFSLISPDEKIWKTGVDLVKKLIDFAAIMGAPRLLLVPGVVDSRNSYDLAMGRLEEAMWILKEDAEKKKVGLGLENVWGKILYSPLEMRDFTDKFKSPYVGVHFDVGNVIQYGYPDQWIRILGKNRLFNIHLKDYNEAINNFTGFTYLFQGSVPWARVMSALREVGYDGYLIAEVPPYPFCPEEGIWDISRKMDILISQKY
jgi:L-ribulose-5-phosphate 3-epimerase